MKVRTSLLSFFLAAAAIASAAPAPANPPPLTDSRFAAIIKYYADCTYVASNGSPEEIARIVSLLRHGTPPRPGLLDFRGRKLLLAIQATQGVVLDPDPGIFWLPPVALEYGYKVTPVAVQGADTTTVDVVVTRESVWSLALPARPAASGLPPDARPGANRRPPAITEIDHWVLMDGTWRLMTLRTCLI